MGLRGLGAVLACVAVAGCGGSGKPPAHPRKTATHTVAIPPQTTPKLPPAVNQLSASERPGSRAFPAAAGRSLIQLARLVKQTARLGPANGVFTPGNQRFAFALTDKANRYIYAPTAVYVASRPGAPARGPFLAPDYPMSVAPRYRSAENEAPGGLAAIYSATIPLPRSGVFDLLSLSRVGGRLIGATGEAAVALRTPVPAVGQRPPAIATDTLASVHGDTALLTTRMPPESMHGVSFNQVLGRRPVALLFSTPELCTSRVCGPVTDIMVSLQRAFPQVTFIHEEVYVDNDPAKGLRPQMRAFHLQTEPWLFTVNRRGVIAARLQGAFGVAEARRALTASLGG